MPKIFLAEEYHDDEEVKCHLLIVLRNKSEAFVFSVDETLVCD